MAESLNCPHCAAILTDEQVRNLHKRYANAQRKTKSGGKNGGRPKLGNLLCDGKTVAPYESERILVAIEET
jgi:hypothetical protein